MRIECWWRVGSADLWLRARACVDARGGTGWLATVEAFGLGMIAPAGRDVLPLQARDAAEGPQAPRARRLDPHRSLPPLRGEPSGSLVKTQRQYHLDLYVVLDVVCSVTSTSTV